MQRPSSGSANLPGNENDAKDRPSGLRIFGLPDDGGLPLQERCNALRQSRRPIPPGGLKSRSKSSTGAPADAALAFSRQALSRQVSPPSWCSRKRGQFSILQTIHTPRYPIIQRNGRRVKSLVPGLLLPRLTL